MFSMKLDSKKNIYNFLTELDDDKVITQKDLSIKLKVSVGFINALIKKLLRKGHIKAQQVPYKRFIYYLTPKGFTEKSKIVSDYFSSSLSFFRTIRNEFSSIFKKEKGFSFVLFGISEITEICILSALENKIKIICVVDKNTTSKNYLGIKVCKSINKLKSKEKLIITDYSSHNLILYKKLSKKYGDDRIVTIPSLHLKGQKNDK